MHALRFSALFAAVSSLAAAASATPQAVTIVLDFQGPKSARSIAEMKREFQSVMKGAGVTFDWRERDQLNSAAAANLVLVRFKGKCVLDPVPYLYDERGPLAFTYSTDGAIQPYAEVACDKVTSSVRSAMSADSTGKGDMLLGRALGRVLAHEMLHILAKSSAHGDEGVARHALSGRQLIAPELKLSPEDAERARAQVR